MSDVSLRRAHQDWLAEPVHENYLRFLNERRRMDLRGLPEMDLRVARMILDTFPRWKRTRKGFYEKGDYKNKLTIREAHNMIVRALEIRGFKQKLRAEFVHTPFVGYEQRELPPPPGYEYAGHESLMPIGFPPERDVDGCSNVWPGNWISPNFDLIVRVGRGRTLSISRWEQYPPERRDSGICKGRWVTAQGFPMDLRLYARSLLHAALRTEDPYLPNPPCSGDYVTGNPGSDRRIRELERRLAEGEPVTGALIRARERAGLIPPRDAELAEFVRHSEVGNLSAIMRSEWSKNFWRISPQPVADATAYLSFMLDYALQLGPRRFPGLAAIQHAFNARDALEYSGRPNEFTAGTELVAHDVMRKTFFSESASEIESRGLLGAALNRMDQEVNGRFANWLLLGRPPAPQPTRPL